MYTYILVSIVLILFLLEVVAKFLLFKPGIEMYSIDNTGKGSLLYIVKTHSTANESITVQ